MNPPFALRDTSADLCDPCACKYDPRPSIYDGFLSIAGYEGCLLKSNQGEHWYIKRPGCTFTESDPNPVSPEIEAGLARVSKDGKLEEVDHIGVNPMTVIRLYLEGRIKQDRDVLTARCIDGVTTFHAIEFATPNGPRHFKVIVSQVDDALTPVFVDKDGAAL